MTPYRRPARFVSRHRQSITFSIFAGGAVIVGLWVIILTGRVNRVEASRTATADANYATCVQSRPLLAKFNAAMEGAETFARTVIRNAEDMHRLTDRTNPIWRQQIINLRRLRARLAASEGLRVPVPTVAVCAARRAADLRR